MANKKVTARITTIPRNNYSWKFNIKGCNNRFCFVFCTQNCTKIRIEIAYYIWNHTSETQYYFDCKNVCRSNRLITIRFSISRCNLPWVIDADLMFLHERLSNKVIFHFEQTTLTMTIHCALIQVYEEHASCSEF